MVTKKEFFSYMSSIYKEEYNDDDLDLYKTFKEIIKLTDSKQLKQLKNLIIMNGKERLLYRHSLAAQGKEFTPLQVDQYISMIELALEHIE